MDSLDFVAPGVRVPVRRVVRIPEPDPVAKMARWTGFWIEAAVQLVALAVLMLSLAAGMIAMR